ncbi:hypothetical protein [Kribbella sp. CA-293567]|uniref:hypothetical protein n=1 Tax=Kribbella sp. CA-293567 TaxID=3002436 RepID=UPI0022DDBDEC|nr:hypothetical protein [Kribbella sp. CA-293567]WBQ07465.1 hypothetical protein OX958_11825 [Kribbella sp. CA-293567]
MFRRTSLAVAVATVAAAATVAVPGTANAGLGVPTPCVEKHDLAGIAFDVKLCGVSDVDQDRMGLEGLGLYYCGPASLLNVMYYFNRHDGAPLGYGSDKVKDLDPLDPADFAKTTSFLWRIGFDAQYKAPGTNAKNLRAAFDVAAAQAVESNWAVESGYTDSKNSPDFAGELATRLSDGPVQLIFGFYQPKSSGVQRDSGHIVTVTGAKGAFGGNELVITYADPSLAGDNTSPDKFKTQSQYRSETATLKKTLIKEYVPADKSWRSVYRWKLSGVDYNTTLTPMVESFNWFDLNQKG